MTLGKKQEEFALAAAKLIAYIYSQGYQVRLGDAFRDPRVHGAYGEKKAPYGETNSMHKLKLAIDLNLFKDGVFLDKTEDHKQFGEWWKKEFAHLDARWGGDFRVKDGNHYSFSMYGGA